MPRVSTPPAPSAPVPGIEPLAIAASAGKVGLWDWNVVTNEVKWTHAVFTIHGVDPATFEVSLENFLSLIHPEDIARVQKRIQQALEEDAAYEVEFRIRRPDGQVAWVFTNGTVLRENGRPVRMIGATLDVTASHQVDDARVRLAAIVESSDDAILSKDLNSIIVTWNRGAERLFGYTEREVVGRPVTILIPSDRQDEEPGILERIRRGEPIDHYETVRRCKDGTLVDVSLTVSPLRDATGRVVGASKIARDITDRRKAQEALRLSEERFRLLTSHAPVGIFLSDPAGSWIFVNEQWCAMAGLSQAEALGEGWTRAVHPDDRAAVLATWRGPVRKGGASTSEFRLLRPDGRVVWLHASAVQFHDGDGFRGYIGSCADVTARKEAELELAKARDEALAASRAKDDFLAALSHELRTPLSPVLLVASDAVNNAALPREVRESFEMIRTNVSLEARLIDDLLDLTSITRGKMPLEMARVDIHEVLRDALANVRSELETRQLDLETEFSAPQSIVLGDPVRLQQVLWNLLKNAVKFTPDGGWIHAATDSTSKPGSILIEVSDNGLGMSPEELNRVFEAFMQGEHASATGSHRFGGLGLGLAISHRLVELHSGRISAASAGRNRGSVFVVELPLAASQENPRALPPAKAVPAGAPTAASAGILLVEDHASTRDALRMLLERRHYQVAAASSAAAARALAATQRFDFVISDVGLPDGDGYQLMTELRTLQPHLQGIAISGYGMDEDLQRSAAAGFTAHLVKPVSINALERALADLTPPSTS